MTDAKPTYIICSEPVTLLLVILQKVQCHFLQFDAPLYCANQPWQRTLFSLVTTHRANSHLVNRCLLDSYKGKF